MIIKYIGAGYIDFTKPPYRMLASTDLFDYGYDYETTVKGKAKNLTPKIEPKTITVVITGKNSDEIDQNKQDLLEIIDKDSFLSKEGKLYFDNYYLPGVFTDSKKPMRYVNANVAEITLIFYPNSAMWRKDEEFKIFSGGYYEEQEFLDYDYDYDYDFMVKNQIGELKNDSYLPSDFILNIYGPTSNPVISIGQNNYGITGSLGANDYVEIDSEKNTITKYFWNGVEMDKENIFYRRLKDFWAFERIESGSNTVVWDGTFEFEIKLIKQRREPLFKEDLPDTPLPPIIPIL